MPVPPQILNLVRVYIVRTAPKAYNAAGKVIEKYITKKFGRYLVEIERRDAFGRDRGRFSNSKVLAKRYN